MTEILSPFFDWGKQFTFRSKGKRLAGWVESHKGEGNISIRRKGITTWKNMEHWGILYYYMLCLCPSIKFCRLARTILNSAPKVVMFLKHSSQRKFLNKIQYTKRTKEELLWLKRWVRYKDYLLSILHLPHLHGAFGGESIVWKPLRTISLLFL